jgi:hypothetical protein
MSNGKNRGREAVNPHPKKSINKRDSFLSMAGVRDQPILMNLLREMPKTQNRVGIQFQTVCPFLIGKKRVVTYE